MSATAPAASPTAGVAATRHGVVLVLASALSIVAWIAHLSSLASLVELSRTRDEVVWVMHALTLALSLVCVAVIVLGIWYVRRTTGQEGDGTPMGRTTFLAWMAIITGSFNLLLILLEGSYVVFIHRHAP
jgi:hypothetical protein